MHIELLTFTATAPGAAGAAAAAVAGDSLTVKNGIISAGVAAIALWSTQQTAGFTQVLTPSAHDTTRGYRAGGPVGVNPSLLPMGVALDMQPQETIAATIAGSAVAGDVEQASMLMRYGDLPGVSQRLLTADQVLRNTERITTIEASIVSAAGPGYSGAALINAGSDLLRANRDYAVMGLSCRTPLHAATIIGPDTGNVRIGAPCTTRMEIQSQWFMLLSRAFGFPAVPVINSGNKGSTFFGCATDEIAGTFVITAYMALLK